LSNLGLSGELQTLCWSSNFLHQNREPVFVHVMALPTLSTHQQTITNPSITADLIGPLLCADQLSTEDRCIGGLVSCFIGDALGAATEGALRLAISLPTLPAKALPPLFF